MTPTYWIRIALGALAIFVVGMVVTTGLKKGRHEVENIMAGSGPVTVPLLGLAFRMDGDPIGGIERVRLLRSAPRHVDSVIVVVKLANDSAEARLGRCAQLMVRDAGNLDENTSFACVDSAATADLELVPFGHVELKPGGRTVAILIPAAVAADLRATRVGDGVAHDTGNVEIDATGSGVSVTVNGERVAAGADSAAGLAVRDRAGRTVVRLRGAAADASVEVKP